MKTVITQTCISCLVLICFMAVPPTACSADDWWFEVGPVVRGGMSASVSGSSYVQQLGVHSVAGSLAPPGGIGTTNQYSDRTYANGYVNLDPGTGNPTSLDPNATWNWGFTPGASARYDAANQTLALDATGAPGYNTLYNNAAGGSANFLSEGLQAVIGRKLKHSGNWSLDACLVFQGTWNGTKHLGFSSYSEDVRQITTTDTYDVSKIGAASFPSGGYQGTYQGPFGSQPPPYPVIPNRPNSRSENTSAALSTSTDTVDLGVRQALYELGVGPQIGFQATKQLQLHLRPTISLNIVDADVQRTETFAGYRWSNSASKCDVLFGLGISGGANLELENGFYVGVSGGYDYVTQNMDVSVGPNTVSLDPSGWVVSGVIGWRF